VSTPGVCSDISELDRESRLRDHAYPIVCRLCRMHTISCRQFQDQSALARNSQRSRHFDAHVFLLVHSVAHLPAFSLKPFATVASLR
jgi:hypothetical protein